jgi:hypothetical protein
VQPHEEPAQRTIFDRMAFLLSAILSPYLVIPIGSLGIIYGRSLPSQFWLFALISVFFSTVMPALYVLLGMARGTITDIHVMERGQRGGPFLVAIGGGFAAGYILWRLHAPPSVWGLSVLLSINGLVIWAITWFTKISVHVSVLSATVLGAIIFHPQIRPWSLLWMIPALIWARTRRGRHSVWQGAGGCLVASVVTGTTIMALNLEERLAQVLLRLF